MSEPLAAAVARDWGLKLGEAYPPGAASVCVLRAELPDGTPAVLKISDPHRESEQEADALERWNGDGAIRLLRRDDERSALLLERCEPGAYLSEAAADPLGVLIELLPRLWVDATGFHTLEDEVAWWGLEGEVGELARELASTQGEQVLVHQDLPGDNVLAAEREPWLVIDPKPLAAEREFAVAPIVRSGELGHSRRDVIYRLDRLCSELGLDRDRARGWTIVQTTAWMEGEGAGGRQEVIEWLS
jgi:streptomycin 6-kinase